MDACLGNSDAALLHRLVNRRSVQLVHLVKLVNANDATIGQDHCACLKTPLARLIVLGDGGSETDATGAATGGVDCARCRFQNVAQQLRLGR